MSRIKYFSWYTLLKLRKWLGIDSRMTRQELLLEVRNARSNIQGLLSEIDPNDVELPGVEGYWSIKELLAHIAVWDRRGPKWIEGSAQGKMPQMPEPALTWKAIDSVNEQTAIEYKDFRFRDVRSDFEQGYQALLNFVEG